jgi:hypothetical protein
MEGQKEHSTGRDRSMEEGVEELVDEATRAMGDVKEEVKERTERWTHSAGQRGESLARALEAAARTLRDEGEGGMADLAQSAARQMDRMGGYLERGEPGAMVDDLEEVGRSNPAMFLGAAFAAGILGGRLLRASAQHDRGTSNGAAPNGKDDKDGEDRAEMDAGSRPLTTRSPDAAYRDPLQPRTGGG